jgi:hypothetical protein
VRANQPLEYGDIEQPRNACGIQSIAITVFAFLTSGFLVHVTIDTVSHDQELSIPEVYGEELAGVLAFKKATKLKDELNEMFDDKERRDSAMQLVN